MPFPDKDFNNRRYTLQEKVYGWLNVAVCVLISAVIVEHSDTYLVKIEFLMRPWLPLLAAIVTAIRIPMFIKDKDVEKTFTNLTLSIILVVILILFAANLRYSTTLP